MNLESSEIWQGSTASASASASARRFFRNHESLNSTMKIHTYLGNSFPSIAREVPNSPIPHTFLGFSPYLWDIKIQAPRLADDVHQLNGSVSSSKKSFVGCTRLYIISYEDQHIWNSQGVFLLNISNPLLEYDSGVPLTTYRNRAPIIPYSKAIVI